ncbi:MAG: 6-phosphogluconolactonase [Anaerolineae bacterium]|jgi:6-phosphogluconolactonase|nr:6-phosphogluconolactonase [Anaerolineae bacterium]
MGVIFRARLAFNREGRLMISSEWVESAAEQIFAHADRAIAQHGRFTIALSGGSSPKRVYERLAEQKTRLDWSRVQIFWGDERCVPPNHPDSNYQMAFQALIREIEPLCGTIHRMRGELPPEKAAERYNETLRSTFETSIPRFDLLLLGMGSDGHTLSLFPHSAALLERDRACVANHVETLNAWRLTLTPPVIEQAHAILFLITGADKADMLQTVRYGAYQPDKYPAQFARDHARVTWLIDTAAS